MKRIVSFLLVFALVLGLASAALAAGSPKITKQPESAVTTKNGTVSFQIKLKNFKGGGITWKLINPQTGETVNASQLSTLFKGIKVSGANRVKLTLKKVPVELHGWSVYCHISQNGYTVDSDIVELRHYDVENGLAAPAPTEQPAAENTDQAAQPEGSPAPDAQADDQQPADQQPAEPQPEDQQPTDQQPADAHPEDQQPDDQQPVDAQPEDAQPADQLPADQQPAEPQPEGPGYTLDDEGDVAEEETEIVVNGENVSLYPLDSRGNVVDDTKSTTLTFENSASIKVVADGPVNYWIIDGMRFEPAESLTGFTLKNITRSLDISAVLQQGASASEVDDAVMCSVTCEGCTFTYLKGDLQSVTSGSVPSGAYITVMADTAEQADRGYSVNGGELSHEEQASFRLQITEDTVIVSK